MFIRVNEENFIIVINAYSIFAVTLATKVTTEYMCDIATTNNFIFFLTRSMIDITISYKAVSTECCYIYANSQIQCQSGRGGGREGGGPNKKINLVGGGCIGEFSRGKGVLVQKKVSRFDLQILISRGWYFCC